MIRAASVLLVGTAFAMLMGAAPAQAGGNLLQSLMGAGGGGGGGAGSLLGSLGSLFSGNRGNAPSYVYAAPPGAYAYAPPSPMPMPPPPSVTRYQPPPPSIDGAPPRLTPSAYMPPAPPRAAAARQSASASIDATRGAKECRHGQWSDDNGQLVVGTACLGPDGWHLY